MLHNIRYACLIVAPFKIFIISKFTDIKADPVGEIGGGNANKSAVVSSDSYGRRLRKRGGENIPSVIVSMFTDKIYASRRRKNSYIRRIAAV